MSMPREAKKRLKVLDTYKVVDTMDYADVLHIYPTRRFGVTNNAYYDSKIFNIWWFNIDTKEKMFTEWFDIVRLDSLKAEVRVFVDGSILIRFRPMIKIPYTNSQDIEISEYKS